MKTTGIWRFALALASITTLSSSLHAQAPAAPTDAVAQASAPGDLSIAVFWNDNSLNEDAFEVQRVISGSGAAFETVYVSPINNVGVYMDIGLEENTSYDYRVRAVNAVGSSAFSNVTTAQTSYARPIQISNLQGSYVAGSVELTWQDVATNETRYDVERAEIGVSTQYDVIATLDPNSTSYVDSTALDGTAYSYRVRPSRFDVEGGAPDTFEVVTGNPIAGPSSVQAKAKSRTSIELSWKVRNSNGKLVQVQRLDLDSGMWQTVSLNQADRKFVDSGLQSKTRYEYRVRVVTDAAVSMWTLVGGTTK